MPRLHRCLAWPLPVLAALAVAVPAARADDWPQWLGPQRDGVWRETGLLDKLPEGGPKVLWRAEVHKGYSGPAVAAGRLYVMDWRRATGADGQPLRATRGGLPGTERVLCLDAANGKPLWQHEYPCPYKVSYPNGPRTTPLVHKGRVYTLGTMGDLFCFDAATGKVVWSRNFVKDYKAPVPVWGWSAHPLLDGDRLYCLVGGDKSAVVAFDKDTGKEVWKNLSAEEIGYSPPMIYEAGGKRQLIVWHTEAINGLDPATGAVYWTQQYPTRGEPQRPAVTIVTPRRLGDLLFITTYYHGPLMLKLAADRPAATVLWQGKSDNAEKPDGLHSLMCSPVLKDGHIYGVCANGELRCLKADTGKQLWQTYAFTGGKKTDCGAAFLVPQGDRFVIFNEQGELILAELTPMGHKEISRARLLEPTHEARGRTVVWSHPAFANRCVFARNDKEIVCVSLAAGPAASASR
jgi:outer membrane protein assembly factor BamB